MNKVDIGGRCAVITEKTLRHRLCGWSAISCILRIWIFIGLQRWTDEERRRGAEYY
jgi:hypothetical protein